MRSTPDRNGVLSRSRPFWARRIVPVRAAATSAPYHLGTRYPNPNMASIVMVRSLGVADNDLVETGSHRIPGGAGWLVATLLVYLWPASALAGPPLETETARVPAQGVVAAENVFEAQEAADGNEFALPLAFTY